MKKNNSPWTDQNPDFRFTNLSEFKYISSPEVPFVVIQFRLDEQSLEGVRKSMKDSLNKDYLGQNGVYFLRLRDGYYIGETKYLGERLTNHIKNKEVDSITIATYKSDEDALNKDGIRDLESLLLQYALENGMSLGENLKNVKNEGRKLNNIFDKKLNEKNAKYIWDKITYLNLGDILDEAKSKVLASSADATEQSVKIASKTMAEIRKGAGEKTGASKRLADANIIKKVDMRNRPSMYNFDDIFYSYAPRRSVPSTGYLRNSAEIFTKEIAKKALFDYLFKGFNNSKTDAIWTNQQKNNGYVTAVTLAFLGLETAGKALGCMSGINEQEAKSLIDEFIERNY